MLDTVVEKVVKRIIIFVSLELEHKSKYVTHTWCKGFGFQEHVEGHVGLEVR